MDVVSIADKHLLEHDGRLIEYNLIRKKVKNINLRINKDLVLSVSANHKVPREHIEKIIRAKAGWIHKCMERIRLAANNKPQNLYISGEIISYLGRPYRLQVIQSMGKEELILEGDNMFLFTRDEGTEEQRKEIVERWIKEQAAITLNLYTDLVHSRVEPYGIARPKITIRKMKTRWGSCSWGRRRITLNSELIKTPPACIEYVILHELAHFKHHDHGPGFYSFISELQPDWKEKRKMLKNYSL